MTKARSFDMIVDTTELPISWQGRKHEDKWCFALPVAALWLLALWLVLSGLLPLLDR